MDYLAIPTPALTHVASPVLFALIIAGIVYLVNYIDSASVGLVKLADKLPRGSVRLARILTAIRPSLRRYRAKTRYGELVCDVSETICHPLITKGEYPYWEHDAIAALPISGTVLDIGANIGVTARIFAEKADHVHAFEPSPRALALLRENAPSNCTIHAIALGDHDGVVHFAEEEAVDESHIAAAGIPVEMRTLDSLGLHPDFIKIDVEGFEAQVLRGGAETLKDAPAIMFEALTNEALDECSSIILSANPNYRISDMGSGRNFYAHAINP